MAGDFCDCSGQFNTGRSTADDHEVHRRPARFFIVDLFRIFKRHKNPAAQLNRVLEALQSRGQFLPLAMSKIGMSGASRENQIIVIDLQIDGFDFFRVDVNGFHLCKDHLDVPAFAQDCAYRRSNVGR